MNRTTHLGLVQVNTSCVEIYSDILAYSSYLLASPNYFSPSILQCRRQITSGEFTAVFTHASLIISAISEIYTNNNQRYRHE